MQSNIPVSPALHTAFNHFLSTPTQRGLLITISSETLIPTATLPTTTPTSTFYDDLPALSPLLSPTTATYILLRRYPNAPDAFVAITYIPDAAPVRQKTLYAATRLTLVRELGAEKFRESISVTEVKELEREGWERHDNSGKAGKPLTEEEATLERVKEAEAQERTGTGERRMHVSGHFSINISEGAKGALEGLKEGGEGMCVQLGIDVKTETIELAGTSLTTAEGLASTISDTEPRFTFFKYIHSSGGDEQFPLIFIYTCPPGSKIKERMVYASTKQGFLSAVGSEIGLEISKKLEASSPSEITAVTLEDEFKPKQEVKQGFSKPKRPGKR